jgi:hypothetical protein
MQVSTVKLESVIKLAERIATIAELVRAADVAAADSRFVPILSDTQPVVVFAERVAEIREYVDMAKRNIAQGMTESKEEIFSELIIGMCQGIVVGMMPGASVTVELGFVSVVL